MGASAVLLYHFVWDVWIVCQTGIVKYSWTRPLSCERPLHQTLQRCIQRLYSEVRADRFIVSARHCLTAFFAAKLCNVLFAGHKALFCQNRRTVYIFQQGKASLVPYFGMGTLYKLLYLALIIPDNKCTGCRRGRGALRLRPAFPAPAAARSNSSPDAMYGPGRTDNTQSLQRQNPPVRSCRGWTAAAAGSGH